MVPTDERPDLELGLEFANTLDWRNGKNGRVASETLTDYDRLVEWSLKHRLFSSDEAKRLARRAKDSGRDKAVLKRAIELREVIYRIFSSAAHERRPDSRDMDALNGFVSESLAKSRVVRNGERFEWSWHGSEEALDMMLWPIARSAADLLTSERVDDVGECANEEEGCGSLFLDCTKSHSRKWCSSTSCGNRDKVRRFYDTHKEVPA